MNKPLIPCILIRVWRYKDFFIADVFDETKRFRGDIFTLNRVDIDSFIEQWKKHAAKSIVEDTTVEPVPA